MCEDDDRLRSLYRALRSIPFDPLEKPSPWENLTDVLEILAVWQGIKPAHLSGHGFRSERLLVDLESVAATVRTVDAADASSPAALAP